MTTVALSTMRSRLRIYLNDTAEKLWPVDAELDLFLNHAAIKFTHDVPAASQKVYTVATDQVDTGGHQFSLPDDFVTDKFIRGTFSGFTTETATELNMARGTWTENDEPVGYVMHFPTQGYLYLPKTPSSTTFTLYYGAYHDDWLTDDTDTLDLGWNRWGEQAVYAYAAFLAFNPSSSRRAQLEQWARRGDQNVGNPLDEEAKRWKALYHELLREHAETPEAWEFARQ